MYVGIATLQINIYLYTYVYIYTYIYICDVFYVKLVNASALNTRVFSVYFNSFVTFPICCVRAHIMYVASVLAQVLCKLSQSSWPSFTSHVTSCRPSPSITRSGPLMRSASPVRLTGYKCIPCASGGLLRCCNAFELPRVVDRSLGRCSCPSPCLHDSINAIQPLDIYVHLGPIYRPNPCTVGSTLQ